MGQWKEALALAVKLLSKGALLVPGLVNAATLQLGNDELYKRCEIQWAHNVLNIESIDAGLFHPADKPISYRPDWSFLSELTVEVDPATEGAARLARALSNVTDCLAVPSVAPADLDSGERGFHLAGAKSYGRARTFLLKNGYSQLDVILSRLDSAA